MKVLYSCLSKSWGGMEMFTLTAVKKLLARDISVELLCIEESRIHIEANNMGIIIHPVKASGYFHPAVAIKLSRIIKNGNFSLIHSQASKDLWLLVPALQFVRSKIPLYLTKQVGSFVIKKDLLHKKLYNRVTKIYAISNYIFNNVLQTCPVKEEKVVVLNNGVDLEIFDPENVDNNKVRNEFNISDDEIVIGMTARFTPGKGHNEFLWAAKELNKEFSNLKYLVVGESSRKESEFSEQTKKLAEDYKLTNCIFTGYRSDMPEVISAMDIFVFPSHKEAFGIALTEAMAMGVPSVCSDAKGIKDIAVDSETSYLFENKNAKDLQNKLSLLIESKEKRDVLSKGSKERAKDFFDIEMLTDKVVEYYKSDLTNLDKN